MGVVVIIVILLCLSAWIGYLQVVTARPLDFHSSLDLPAARSLAQSTFHSSWVAVSGPGQLNYSPGLRRIGPTISIDLVPGATGGSEVSIWISNKETRFGVMGQALRVWWVRRRLALRLSHP